MDAMISLDDVRSARDVVARTLRPTALLKHPLLDAETGLDIHVKHENHNPTGAFKVRGGLNLIGRLSPTERRGVITATTGNHGQSIALACQREGVPCTIVVPRGNNPEKNAAMRAFGATVLEVGRDFDEAREHVEEIQRTGALRYVHSANEPHLIAGVATYALEIFEALPDADYVFVPVGGGSGAAGCCIVRGGKGARAKIVGAQALGADAFARSWRGPERVTGDRVETLAEGVATRVTFDLTFGVLKAQLDAVVTLDEEELREGLRAALTLTHNLAEGAGAAPLAAARQQARAIAGTKVVCVMTGGNVDLRTLRHVIGGP